MSDKLKEKSILVVDHGLSVSVAERLARDFGKVYYFCPWTSALPTSNLADIGLGLENVTRTEKMWDAVKLVDAVVFPDVYESDVQAHIESLGIPVWGSRDGDELELNRWKFRALLKKLGMPVTKAERFVGIAALRRYLMDHEDKFIKVSKYRGTMETWHHFDYPSSESKLDYLELQLGGRKRKQEFICEDPIDDAVEIGYDGYYCKGFPDSSMVGIEVKDMGYCGSIQPYDDLPSEIRDVNDKLAPILASYDVRNFFSTEIRINDGKGYLIDPTLRQPCPPGELYQEMFENFSEIIWEGAHGKLVNPIPSAKVGVEALIYSKDGDRWWTAIQMEKAVENYCKIFNHFREDSIDYCVPTDSQMKAVGVVLGLGDTLQEAIDHLRKNADGIHGCGLDIRIDPLVRAIMEIEEAKEEGIEFIDGPIPKVEDVVE